MRALTENEVSTLKNALTIAIDRFGDNITYLQNAGEATLYPIVDHFRKQINESQELYNLLEDAFEISIKGEAT